MIFISATRFIPRYFDSNFDSGIPTLTDEGYKALHEEMKEEAGHTLEDVPENFGRST